MEITLKRHRYDTIYNWKRKGVIYPDYDELYKTYINTLECQHCLKVFTTTKERHLDHCHKTGQFRKIVCHNCNNHDNYIKYPDGYTQEDRKKYETEYRQVNSQKIKDWKHQKHNCECGGKYTHGSKSKHLKSKKHTKYLDNNN